MDQAVGMRAIDGEALGLAIRAEGAAHVRALVPVQPQPLQVGDELIFEADFAAVDVGVFDAEHHGSTLLAGEEPIEERGAGVADMKVASGGWSEADTDVLGHEEMLAGVLFRRARRPAPLQAMGIGAILGPRRSRFDPPSSNGRFFRLRSRCCGQVLFLPSRRWRPAVLDLVEVLAQSLNNLLFAGIVDFGPQLLE